MLLVFHHTWDLTTPAVVNAKWTAPLTGFFGPLRMPLFTAISGYLYAGRPVATGAPIGPLMRGKMRRLLIPLAACLTTLLVLGWLGAGYWLFPPPRPTAWLDGLSFYTHRPITYWFLWALFWVFLVVALLDARGWLDRPGRWMVWWIGSILLTGLLLHKYSLPWFCVGGTLYLLPPFLTGLGVRRFIEPALASASAPRTTLEAAPETSAPVRRVLRWLPWIALPVFLIAGAISAWERTPTPPGWIESMHHVPLAVPIQMIADACRDRLTFLPANFLQTAPPLSHLRDVIAGCLIAALLLSHRRSIPAAIAAPLARLGFYAYGIYLFHRPVMTLWDRLILRRIPSPDRPALPESFVDAWPPWVAWPVYSLSVIALCIGIEMLFRRYRFTRRGVLGLSR